MSVAGTPPEAAISWMNAPSSKEKRALGAGSACSLTPHPPSRICPCQPDMVNTCALTRVQQEAMQVGLESSWCGSVQTIAYTMAVSAHCLLEGLIEDPDERPAMDRQICKCSWGGICRCNMLLWSQRIQCQLQQNNFRVAPSIASPRAKQCTIGHKKSFWRCCRSRGFFHPAAPCPELHMICQLTCCVVRGRQLRLAIPQVCRMEITHWLVRKESNHESFAAW